MNDFNRLAKALEATMGSGQITGFTSGERVYVLINDGPDQLRQIADVIESMGLKEVHAVISYPKPSGETLPLTSSAPDKTGSREKEGSSQQLNSSDDIKDSNEQREP